MGLLRFDSKILLALVVALMWISPLTAASAPAVESGPTQTLAPSRHPPAHGIPRSSAALFAAEWPDDAPDAPVSGPFPQAPDQDDPFPAIDACLQQEMSQRGYPGASMAIAMDGKLVHASAFGVRRRGAAERVDTETIFRINSTTKMMGAAAVMQLVEQGQLDLHAPITDYIPELAFAAPWSASDLTLHNLLANAGAMPDPYLDFSLMPQVHDIPAWDIDLTGWANRLRTMHLYATPGSFWNYSSPNFSIAGLAVERVTGMRWEDYVVEKLFRPAGMGVATFDPAAVVASGNYANGHYQELVYEPADYQRPYAAPGGGAFMTPTELVTWALQLMGEGGEILSPESVAAMTTRHLQGRVRALGPALGLRLRHLHRRLSARRRPRARRHGLPAPRQRPRPRHGALLAARAGLRHRHPHQPARHDARHRRLRPASPGRHRAGAAAGNREPAIHLGPLCRQLCGAGCLRLSLDRPRREDRQSSCTSIIPTGTWCRPSTRPSPNRHGWRIASWTPSATATSRTRPSPSSRAGRTRSTRAGYATSTSSVSASVACPRGSTSRAGAVRGSSSSRPTPSKRRASRLSASSSRGAGPTSPSLRRTRRIRRAAASGSTSRSMATWATWAPGSRARRTTCSACI